MVSFLPGSRFDITKQKAAGMKGLAAFLVRASFSASVHIPRFHRETRTDATQNGFFDAGDGEYRDREGFDLQN